METNIGRHICFFGGFFAWKGNLRLMQVTVKDIVCGMEINEKKAAKALYKGKEYFFCSPACQWAFESNPEQFITGNKIAMK